jgi:type VI secretion system protein ImpF
MAKIHADQPLVPSILDRLIDLEPETQREAPTGRSQILREMKLAVQRDLENLLNTRRRYLDCPPDLKELKQSLATYGIPDFLGLSMATVKDRENFCRTLQVVIKQYEPRFKTVTVQLQSNAESLDRTLRFRIDALLHADPAPEPVVFDSALEPATGVFAVKGVG